MRVTRSTIVVGVVGTLVAACTGVANGPTPPPLPVATVDLPSPSPSSDAIVGAPGARDAWLVVGRRGVDGLQVILASTAEKDYDLPIGVPNEKWGQLLTVRRDGTRTVVLDMPIQPGFGGKERPIDGAWMLPTFGPDATPVGVSADRQTVVLVEERPAVADRTRFAVLHRIADTPIVLDVPGTLAYDAMSPDGSTIFAIEHLPAPPVAHYQVRAIDVATGKLLSGVVVDKLKTDEAMGGWPLAQLARPSGLVLTLYRGAEHPFIHALDTAQRLAVCIDLPASPGDADDAEDWGLGEAPSGTVYAVNATLGRVVEVDANDLRVTRTATITPSRGASISLAKFGHAELGPVGRRLLVSPDGATLYAAGRGGITTLRTKDLGQGSTFVAGHAVGALGMAPDGDAIYALLKDGGRIAKLDAASGELEGFVPGEGYDRLLAIAPW